MPAKSEAQRKLLNVKFGHEWVKEHHFANKGKLPAKVKPKAKPKKHKGKKGGHHHTGHIRHADMTSLPVGMGSRDPHASAEHHAANSAQGMSMGLGGPGGMTPPPEEGGSNDQGGEGMMGNCEHCE